ncbi:MAG: DUF1109 domain-containing protein [Proteobacteria bacterium]|nr:DUF1109 domain-containing protein [Pseudomonadota bacterium]
MKTEELIRELASETLGPVVPISQALNRALWLGLAASSVLFGAILQPRADLGAAIDSGALLFKFGFALSLVVTTAVLLPHLARPLPIVRWNPLLLLPPLVLAAGIMIELLTVPEGEWAGRLTGHHAARCLALIPLISAPTLACLLFSLRRGAPAHPAAAGVVAGLVSGGIGTLLYSLSCRNDSPLFVATWYTLANVLLACASAYLGKRLLRW